jgi:phosphatidylglycerol---prolipoprotein diacylglyceryl transferase
MFVFDINPILLSIGPLHIRWYGLIYVAGILITFYLFKHLARKRSLPLDEKDFDSLLIYGIVGVLIGARLGSVLSDFSFYAANPVQVVAIWNGGLAFHGGLVGLIVAGLMFSKKRKMRFYDIADIIVIPAALALALGRIANFINGEFYGTPTSLPWGVMFPGVEGARHPVQLYESLKNLAVFAVLWLLKDKALPKGALFWLFIFLYSAGRFMTEFTKDLPPLLFSLTWGQLWGIPLMALSIFAFWRIANKPGVV